MAAFPNNNQLDVAFFPQTGILVQLQERQADLETSLLLTKSNLTLALSNTEMLEEALQRADSMKGKDVGWRRWSDREGLLKRTQASVSNFPGDPTGRISEDGSETSKRHTYQGMHENNSSESDHRIPPKSQPEVPSPNTLPSLLPASTSTAPPSRTPNATPPPAGDGGFFSRLRFGKANASSSNILESSTTTSRFATASLPALATSLDAVPAAPAPTESPRDALLAAEKKRTAELEKLLECERKAKADIIAEKAGIETELESLSTALFEEANKMVVAERIKRAEAEEELKIANDEKEALRSALRIVESENKAGRSTISRSLLEPLDMPSRSSLSSLSGANLRTRRIGDASTDSIDSQANVTAVSAGPDDTTSSEADDFVLLDQGTPTATSSRTDNNKETSPAPPLPLRLTSPPLSTPTDTNPETEPEPGEREGAVIPSAENEIPQIKTTLLTPSPSSPVTPSRSKLSIPPSPSLSSPSRYSPSPSSPSPSFQRDPTSGVIVSRVPLSSRVAAARQAFEAGGGDGTIRKVKPRRSSPPPPVKIPGHIPRLPTPKPARSASTTSVKEDGKI